MPSELYTNVSEYNSNSVTTLLVDLSKFNTPEMFNGLPYNISEFKTATKLAYNHCRACRGAPITSATSARISYRNNTAIVTMNRTKFAPSYAEDTCTPSSACLCKFGLPSIWPGTIDQTSLWRPEYLGPRTLPYSGGLLSCNKTHNFASPIPTDADWCDLKARKSLSSMSDLATIPTSGAPVATAYRVGRCLSLMSCEDLIGDTNCIVDGTHASGLARYPIDLLGLCRSLSTWTPTPPGCKDLKAKYRDQRCCTKAPTKAPTTSGFGDGINISQVT